MRVHKIQSQTNQNISFNARFINDQNGYLLGLWKNTKKYSMFEKMVDIFHKENKGHTLEVIDVKKDKESGVGSIYEVFNHRNGVSKKYWSYYSLSDLLKEIITDKELFNETSKEARMFQKLTGQKQAVDVII